MTDASINIALRLVDQATAPMRQAMGEIERQTRGINTALKATAGLFAGFLGAGAVGQVVQIADSMTLLHNRLNLVGGDMDDLVKIARTTHQSLDATATVYTRLARSVQDYGYTQQQVLDVTQALNQAVIVSGATAEEASAALIQLSQGLASGTLRGDELRSVLEQLPEVGRMIADGMGVAYGELRELGKQGKITTQMVMDAILKMKDRVAEAQKGMTTTVGQAMQDLSTSWSTAIDKINQMEGASGGLAETIEWLSEVVAKAPQAWAGFRGILDAFMFGFVELDIKINEFIADYNRAVVALNNNPIGDWFVSDASARSAEQWLKKTEDHLKEQKRLLEEIRKGWQEHYDMFVHGVNYEPVKRTRHDKSTAAGLASSTDETDRQTQAVDRLVVKVKDLKDASRDMSETWDSSMHRIESTARTVFGDVIHGQFMSIGDEFRKLCEQMLMDWIFTQAKMAMSSSGMGVMDWVTKGIGWAAGIFGAASGAGGVSTEMGAMSASSTYAMNADLVSAAGQVSYEIPWYATVAHTGWYVGMEPSPATRAVSPSIFAAAPRLHDGLEPDEYPAILQRGERVIDRSRAGRRDNDPQPQVNITIYALDGKSVEDVMYRYAEQLFTGSQAAAGAARRV